jgi:glutamyl-Q tRNA(Asp) synthetase
VPGSADQILRTLEIFGFEWDEPVLWQSRRRDAYAEAAARLQSAGLAYECTCSRTEIAAAPENSVPSGAEELHYPGWCRQGPLHPARARALRFVASTGPICFVDLLQGEIVGDVATESGDFVIRRRDGQFAYQLAVVVDDAAQRITHVVRGADLLTSTPRQIILQRSLGLTTPVYTHLPLAVDKSLAKLSKSAGAGALDLIKPSVQLWQALEFLRQQPPAGLRSASLRELWDWAIPHWQSAALCGIRSMELGL